MAGKHTEVTAKAKAMKKKGGNHQENGKVKVDNPAERNQNHDSRKKKKIGNDIDDEEDERDIVADSVSESMSEGYENGEVAPDSEEDVRGNGEEEEEVESFKIANSVSMKGKEKEGGNAKKNSNRKDEKKGKKNGKVNEAAPLYSFPMHRVTRMIKADDPDIRITQEAVFLVNKASEKFLELFTKEGYANSFLEKKKHVDYKHLSCVVSKKRRFDFLSDFVPEKVKAEVALAEAPATNQ